MPLCLVHADPVKPREERRVASERADPAPGSKEGLLGDLLGGLGSQTQPPDDLLQPLAVPAGQLFERDSIPALRTCDQHTIGIIGRATIPHPGAGRAGPHGKAFHASERAALVNV